MNLDALRSLQEQASPGPWEWRTYSDGDWSGADDEFLAFDQLRADDGEPVAFGVWCNDSTADIGVHNAATAKLLALATHLLPIAEMLEEAIDNNTPGTAKAYHDPPCDECMGCRARKALKALQGALE